MMKRRGFIQSIAAGIAALFGVRAVAERGDTPNGWRHFYNNDVNEESFAGLPDPSASVTYHQFLIRRGDDVDVLFSESFHNPTLPEGWKVAAYIGGWKT